MEHNTAGEQQPKEVSNSPLMEEIAGVLYKNKTDEADDGCWIEGKDFYKIANLIAEQMQPTTPLSEGEQKDQHFYAIKDLMVVAMNKNVTPEEWVSICKGLGYLVVRNPPKPELSERERERVLGILREGLTASPIEIKREEMVYETAKAVKDDDGHWYVIPNGMIDTFYKLLEGGEKKEDEFIELFSDYRTGGDLNLVQLYVKK